jgi:phosphoribosylformylglycinamidine cyclo-ligase
MIEIAKNFQIDAQIIGTVEPFDGKKLTVSGSWGDIVYP